MNTKSMKKEPRPRPLREALRPVIKGHPGAYAKCVSQAPRPQSPWEGEHHAERELAPCGRGLENFQTTQWGREILLSMERGRSHYGAISGRREEEPLGRRSCFHGDEIRGLGPLAPGLVSVWEQVWPHAHPPGPCAAGCHRLTCVYDRLLLQGEG